MMRSEEANQSLADPEEESMDREKYTEDTALELPGGFLHFGK